MTCTVLTARFSAHTPMPGTRSASKHTYEKMAILRCLREISIPIPVGFSHFQLSLFIMNTFVERSSLSILLSCFKKNSTTSYVAIPTRSFLWSVAWLDVGIDPNPI